MFSLKFEVCDDRRIQRCILGCPLRDPLERLDILVFKDDLIIHLLGPSLTHRLLDLGTDPHPALPRAELIRSHASQNLHRAHGPTH